MDKNEINAFTDGVVAIIMTIMVLEIKTPEVNDWTALIKESTHFIAFILSFCFICAAWYNRRYLMNNVKTISKKVYWVNNWWMLSMAIIPVSTSWVSSYPLSIAPEYFYFIVFMIWIFAYHVLDKVIYDENIKDNYRKEEKYKYKKHSDFHYKFDIAVGIIGLIGIYFLPPICLFLVAIQIVSWVVINPRQYNISEL